MLIILESIKIWIWWAYHVNHLARVQLNAEEFATRFQVNGKKY